MTKDQMPNTKGEREARQEPRPTGAARGDARPPVRGDSGEARTAFTLIELLVTIAIIGALAALVLPLSGIATTKMRISRVKAELNRYVNAIESYKLETGEYPQDHGQLNLVSSNDWKLYHERAALNPLVYELTGAIYTNRQYLVLADNEELSATTFDKLFKRRGVRNSARNKNDIDFKGFTLKEAQREEINPQSYSLSANDDIEILKVPVPGPFMMEARKNVKFNPWFYDASSTNRHNKNSYDLWAEILVQGKTNVIGNWK
jgi:prepilin-type N-terminal cleavage/methylation domain-containing protein